MNGQTIFLFFGGFVHATLDLDRKTMSEHRHVIYQSNQKGVYKTNGQSSGVFDFLIIKDVRPKH
jgi:hypothetical protein